MVYADYEYYIEKYYGTLPENSFCSFILKASKEIDNNVNTRLTESVIDALPIQAQDQLKYTACALTDLMAKKQKSDNREVTSISIDEVDKTYKVISNEDYLQLKKDIIRSLPDELTRYL